MDIIEEYSEEYCLALETAYGQSMMSEGGQDGIESLFQGILLQNKTALDIGSGLGGVAHYLAGAYHMQITGVEINPWMVEEATRRTPQYLQSKVKFVLLEDDGLPMCDQSLDIVYSKGVFTQIADKATLFSEIYRVLKQNGQLVIADWLSPVQGCWGPLISKMAEAEGLSLYAQTEQGYREELEQAGFTTIEISNQNTLYAQFNHEIAQTLASERKAAFIERFGEHTLNEHIRGYQLIAEAITTNELLVRYIFARKS